MLPDTKEQDPWSTLVVTIAGEQDRDAFARLFQHFAPLLKSYALSYAGALNALGLPGAHFRPLHFKPTFHKHAGALCGGVFVHVTAPREFPAVLAGVAVVQAARGPGGEGCAFLEQVYEFVTEHLSFDLLAGSSALREAIIGGASLEDIRAMWRRGEREFIARREGPDYMRALLASALTNGDVQGVLRSARSFTADPADIERQWRPWLAPFAEPYR